MAPIRKVRPDDPPHLKAAFSKLGLSEIAGPKHEKQVLAMYKACGHDIDDDETAWCAAFVGWCLSQAGLPNSRSLMARSYVKYGTRQSASLRIPRGAICVWPRGAPPSGHVNFCLDDDGETLTLIGGNQSNGKGGGVTITTESKSHLIAAVLPKAVVAPKPPLPPDVEPPAPPAPPEEPDTKPAVQSTEIWSQLAAILATIGSVVTDIRFLALIAVLFCAYQIWVRYQRGDIKGWFRRKS